MDPDPGEPTSAAGPGPDTEYPTTTLRREPIVIPAGHATIALPVPAPVEDSTSVMDRTGESSTSVFDPGEGGTRVYPGTAPAPSTSLVPLPPVAPPPVAASPSAAAVATAMGVAVAPSTMPGWYPDPWSAGRAGVMRYWDGAAWTGYAAQSPAAGLAPGPVQRRLGVPGWLLGLWWFLVALVGAGVFFIVVLTSAFACDSGWEGCAQAGADAITTYVAVTVVVATAPPIAAVLAGRGRRLGRALRITALVVMPLAPLLGFLAVIGIYWMRIPR